MAKQCAERFNKGSRTKTRFGMLVALIIMPKAHVFLYAVTCSVYFFMMELVSCAYVLDLLGVSQPVTYSIIQPVIFYFIIKLVARNFFIFELSLLYKFIP